MLVPDELRYSGDHEWVRLTGKIARVGVTDYAQDALGDVVFVQLPDPGRSVSSGESCSEVESTKSVSDIFAPVSGSVVAVNQAQADHPELINSDPYGEGWIFEVEVDGDDALDQLMDAAAYRTLTDG